MLEQLLSQQIEHQGPMRLDHFIDQALYHPQYGYYCTRFPVGKDQDFITAPEICSLFGELIGLFFLDYWERAGCPFPVRLVELGPGKGTLMAEILKVFRLRPDIFNHLTVHMVEISDSLKQTQQQLLQSYSFISWHRFIEEVPTGFQLIVGNEFFDAFPIRQFRYNKTWTEQFVTYHSGKFCFLEQSLDQPPVEFTPELPCFVETSPLSLEYADRLAKKMKEQGGLGLFIDYGSEKTPWVGDSLQALKNHRYVDALSEVGIADITHHVDFLSLKQQFHFNGLATFPLLTQAYFLKALGIELRFQQQQQKLTSSHLKKLQLAIFRLINPQSMGELFKVFATSFPDKNQSHLITPAGF